MYYELIIKTLIVVVFLLTVINLYNVFIRYQNVNYVAKRVARAIEIEGQVNGSVTSLFNSLNSQLGLNASYQVTNTSYFDASRKIQLRNTFTVEVRASFNFHILSPMFAPPVVIGIPLKANITGMSEVYLETVKRKIIQYNRTRITPHCLIDKSGSMFVFILIILIFLLTFSAVIGEYFRIHSIQTHCEVELQRAVNVCVEEAIIDSFRQDKLGRLDTSRATQNFSRYLTQDMGLSSAREMVSGGTLVYSLQFNSISTTIDPPRLFVRGTVSIPSAYPFLIQSVQVPFSVASRNRRLDD
jgi:uncharacterized membrane protein